MLFVKCYGSLFIPMPYLYREETCERLSKERNQQYISSHNHPDVIIGQVSKYFSKKNVAGLSNHESNLMAIFCTLI